MTAQRLRILAGARARPSWVLAALVVLASAASAAERQPLDPAAFPHIVNGLTTQPYAAVGALLRGDLTAPTEHLPITADTATPYCSGTLIGRDGQPVGQPERCGPPTGTPKRVSPSVMEPGG